MGLSDQLTRRDRSQLPRPMARHYRKILECEFPVMIHCYVWRPAKPSGKPSASAEVCVFAAESPNRVTLAAYV